MQNPTVTVFVKLTRQLFLPLRTVTRGTGRSSETRYCLAGRQRSQGDNVMFENNVAELAELEDILFDVPDDALERAAAVASGQAPAIVTVATSRGNFPIDWPQCLPGCWGLFIWSYPKKRSLVYRERLTNPSACSQPNPRTRQKT